MITDKLITPVGTFRVYRNSVICSFSIEESGYNSFWLNDDTEVHPEGCYNISLDLVSYSVGDLITCELDNGEMVDDGGDENTMNLVGEIDDYIIGIGAPDSGSYELLYSKDDWPKDMNYTKFELPYDTWDITKRGYVFKIKNNPVDYRDKYYRKYIELILSGKRKKRTMHGKLYHF